MNFNFSKFFLKTLFVTFLVLCLSTPVYAQLEDYTVLTELPGTTISGGKATFQSYLPGAFKLAIGISAVLAFVMITYGGILYATTDAISGKEDGKGYITNAVYGLVLVIGAWAILYTINPRMLEFNLNLAVPNLGTTTPPIINAGGPGAGTGAHSYVSNGTTVYYNDCTNCQTLSSLGITTVNAGANPMVDGGLAASLAMMKSQLTIPWTVTEAYPPTVNHQNACHKIGTCIDVKPNDQTPANINAFAQAAQKAGLRPVYEVKTQAEKDELIKAGVTARIDVVSHITGRHFSVYK